MENGWNQRDSNMTVECPIAASSFLVEIPENKDDSFHKLGNPGDMAFRALIGHHPGMYARSIILSNQPTTQQN